MAQNVRSAGKRPDAFWETIRDRIDTAHAVTVYNEYVAGKHDDLQRAALAWKAIDKQLPSMQALAIQVQEANPATKHDIDAMLMAEGINPDQAFGTKAEAIESTATVVEKK